MTVSVELFIAMFTRIHSYCYGLVMNILNCFWDVV